jgi:hypothetical protein
LPEWSFGKKGKSHFCGVGRVDFRVGEQNYEKDAIFGGKIDVFAKMAEWVLDNENKIAEKFSFLRSWQS